MLTLLTTTGARPAAFALCERMMFRQTHAGPVTWVIVDDGPISQPLGECRLGWRRIVHRPAPSWSPGENTQGRNLREGLAIARHEAAENGCTLRLVIIEDDDWYDRRWLSHVNAMLNGEAELVGEGDARFYNVAIRLCEQFDNKTYSSLRSSAMKDAAIDLFEEVITRPIRLFDMALWKAARQYAIDCSNLTIGMKAMPGRAGIAAGHDGMIGKPDFNGATLRRWVGEEDAKLYERFSAIKEGDMMKLTAAKKFTYRTRHLTAGDPFEAPVKIGRYFVKSRRATLRREDERELQSSAPDSSLAPQGDGEQAPLTTEGADTLEGDENGGAAAPLEGETDRSSETPDEDVEDQTAGPAAPAAAEVREPVTGKSRTRKTKTAAKKEGGLGL